MTLIFRTSPTRIPPRAINSSMMRLRGMTVDVFPPLLSDQTNDRIIDARHKFAKKSYFDKFSWIPADEIIAAIAEATFGKFI